MWCNGGLLYLSIVSILDYKTFLTKPLKGIELECGVLGFRGDAYSD